jgi:hypothetical protein
MIKKDDLKDLEKYSSWLRINRQLEGPLFTFSVSYIALYLGILVFITIKQLPVDSLFIYLVIGFIIFCFAMYIAFIGMILRGMRQ